MWGSLNVPFDDGFKVMEETLEIDPDFRVFPRTISSLLCTKCYSI
jgi:hypothetical protein